METTTPQAYSAKRIAFAADLPLRSVYVGLERIAGQLGAPGGPESRYRFEDFPLDWQERITRRGIKRGFKDGPTFLASVWLPSVSWDRLPENHKNKATKLQDALLPALRLKFPIDPAQEPAAVSSVEQAALDGYKAEFGYVVHVRTIRELLKRTIERDLGEHDWLQQIIYVDERAFTAHKAKAQATTDDYQHRDALEHEIEGMEDRANPTDIDQQKFWDAAFVHYEEHTGNFPDTADGNRKRRRFRASLIAYIARSVPQGRIWQSIARLPRLFEDKKAKWIAGNRKPGALADGRDGSWRVAKHLCSECRKLAVAAIAGPRGLSGNKRGAIIRLINEQQFCADCSSWLTFDLRTGQQTMVQSVIRDIRPEIETVLDHLHGEKHARLNSPYIKLNHSDYGPGDYSVYDDATPDHVIYGEVDLPPAYEEKDGRTFVGRMEILFAFDTRTDYPEAYYIILGDPPTQKEPARKASYNMIHQRLLILRQHDQLGLPHIAFEMENGPWRNRLNDGDRVTHWENISYANFANGLLNATGRRISRKRANNPRSKIAERIFRAVWDRMKCHPGYLGNNERMDRRQRMQEFILRAKAGKENPANEMFSVSEYNQVLSEELMAFAEQPQRGERLPGVSPKEAWLNGIDGHPGYTAKPLEKLPENVRWLLATHEREVRVTGQGIIIDIAGRYPFWGPELEPYMHQKLLCRFNLEEPALLSCCPKDGKPFTVRAKEANSKTEPAANMAQNARQLASWLRRGKVLADRLEHPFISTVERDHNFPQEAHTFGKWNKAQVEKAKEEGSEQDRKFRRLKAQADASGVALPAHIRNVDDASDALARRDYFLKKMDEEGAQ